MTQHKLVPVEPTKEMIDAAFADIEIGFGSGPTLLYKVMIAAAPEPVQVPYGWHVPGSNELLYGKYAKSDAEVDAIQCGIGGQEVALYSAPPNTNALLRQAIDALRAMRRHERDDLDMCDEAIDAIRKHLGESK